MYYPGIFLIILVIIFILVGLLWFNYYQQPATIPDQKIEPGKTKRIVNKGSLYKYIQSEHEIDTLMRSYIIEKLCSCQESYMTYERIEHLCDKAGEYLSVSYGLQFGQEYADIRKSICREFKKRVDDKGENIDKWNEYESKLAHHLASKFKFLSVEFLEKTRQNHVEAVNKLFIAHYKKKDLEAMVLYDKVKETTDAFVEHLTFKEIE